MSRREKIEKTMDAGPQGPTAIVLLVALIEANQIQARSLEELKRRIDAEAEEASRKEAEQAALLGEARRELAEKGAALEMEKKRREAADARVSELEAFVTVIRAALPPVQATMMPDMHESATETVDASANGSAIEISGVAMSPAATETQEIETTPIASDMPAESIDANSASDEPTRPTTIVVDLVAAEVATLGRVARQQGVSSEQWVANLVRRELRATALNVERAPPSQTRDAKEPSG